MFNNKKVLIITPHLSTGGCPQYLLEFLLENHKNFNDLLVVEHSNFSNEFVIQKNKIKNLIGDHKLITLGNYGENEPIYTLKRKRLIEIIETFKPEVIWMNEFPESYDYQLPPDEVMDFLYRKDRNYKIIETTHYNAFDFNSKKYIPDEFMFCSNIHIDKSQNINIPKYIWEVPLHPKKRPDRKKTLESLGLDHNKLHILNVGLFHNNKNQKYIFEIAKKYTDKNVQFHFIGNTCFLNDCNIGDDINLKNCKVWGERNDVDVFMSCMDIYLFPSKKELNPLTVKESLSWGMDVVVNRDENYTHQYKNIDNFYLLDEIDIYEFINNYLKKGRFLLVTSFYNNTKEHVETTFKNVLKQTYKNWILIVGDDFSDDANFRQYLKNRVIELNDKRIIYYDVKEKRELYLYQNFFKEFDYDYYFDLDADDIIDENILHIYDSHFKKYPNIKSIFSNLSQTSDDGKLLKYYMIEPVDNYVEEFNMRTNTKTDDLWVNRLSYSMFGHGRCMRRPEENFMKIVGNQKTSTDSLFLFYNLNRGDHLNLPRNLYTYVKRDGSDSGIMSEYEFSSFNKNAQYHIDLYKTKENRGVWFNIYDKIWNETSALSVCEFIKDVDKLTIFTDNICENEINQLYPDKEITFNNYEEKNAVVVWNSISKENIETLKDKLDQFENLTIYYVNEDFNITENLHESLSYKNNSILKDISKTLSNYTWFDFFRHLVITKKKKVEKNNIIITYNNGVKIRIVGNEDKKYEVFFINDENNNIIHKDVISNNMWVSPSVRYFVKWRIEVWSDNKLIKKEIMDLSNKKVLITFDSKSLGDSIAWIPYVEEFRKKHNCDVYCATFRNDLYEKEYTQIKFLNIGETNFNYYTSYNIGWYYNKNLNPIDVRTIPLQKTASDILGLDYKEIRTKITKPNQDRPIQEKYVTISVHSTSQCKYWNKIGGWEKVVEYLNSFGYKVLCIDQHFAFGVGQTTNVIPSNSLDYTNKSLSEIMDLLYYSEFHIGISSGISWLAWALGKKVLMVSSFSKPMCEFKEDCYRVYKQTDQSGYFNNTDFKFDPSDWNWNPYKKMESLDDWDEFEPIEIEDVLNVIKKIFKKKC
jgi:autotransporter strand-loop-strand O-heptosyltransferase